MTIKKFLNPVFDLNYKTHQTDSDYFKLRDLNSFSDSLNLMGYTKSKPDGFSYSPYVANPLDYYKHKQQKIIDTIDIYLTTTISI